MLTNTNKAFSKINKYGFIAGIYLLSVVSSSLANSIEGNVQNFYRIPFLNIRWIDVSILIVLFSFFYNSISQRRLFKNTNLIRWLCLIYLVFESFQLLRSWGLNDATSQISLFLCTLSLFIIIDLITYPLPIDTIVDFLRKFAICGAFAVIISNFYLLYSFFSGKVVYEDLGIRVAIEVVGSKETVSTCVLTPFVYAFGLYFIQKTNHFWEKVLFLCTILSIYGSLVITIYRGSLLAIAIITVYFFFSSKNVKQTLSKIVGLLFFISLSYLIFGEALANKGYDPIKKIVQTIVFTADVKNADWDKGRLSSQEYAIKAWEKNLWIGAGYDGLEHYGLPDDVATAHNGIITSLFHRGVLGTIVLMLIFILLFKYSISLWCILTEKTYQNEMMKLLILVGFLWIIPFMTQEILWEKYSLSIEFLYLGFIANFYKQQETVSSGQI
jgi:hypothetical protein